MGLFEVLPISFVLCLPAWYVAFKRGTWFELDYVSVFAPMLFWFMLSILRVGSQSLSNLVELLVIAVFVPIAMSFRVFVVDRFSKNSWRSSILTCVLCLALPLGLRLFMPVLAE